MKSPILPLRAAIIAVCENDAELVSLMGGTLRLHDEPPHGSQPIYAVFGDVNASDWSTDLDRGHEQTLSISVWCKAGSARDGLRAAERFAALLDDAQLAPNGHRLVNLRVTAIAAARDSESRLMRARVDLRAVTEEL
jgi:hypothetical protein